MRGPVGFAVAVAFLLLAASVLPAQADRPAPTPTADPILRVGSPDEMNTRNPLPAIAQDPWTRYVLDRIYDTVLLRNATTEAPIASVAKGIDANENGMFDATEYDAWEEPTPAATPLTITVYYDFNGVRWHDGTQMDVWDLFFSYHVNAMHPIWNSALRVLFAGGTGATYEAGNRQLGVALAAKNWQGEASLPGDPNLRVAVTFTLNEPWALTGRMFAPTLLPMHEWSRTGTGRHVDFGCAVWIPVAEAAARGIPECGTNVPALYGQGIRATDTVPGSHPFTYSDAEGWSMADADVIGSGPFRFTRWVPGITADLTRNDDYYTGVNATDGTVYDPVLPTRIHKPFIGGITFRVYRNNPLLVFALENGDIDYIHAPILAEFVPDLLAHPGIAVTARAGPGFTYLGYNLRRQPWGYNPLNGSRDDGYILRQAVSRVIDRLAFVSNLLQNFGGMMYGFVHPGNTFWYDDNIPKQGYDLTAAMNLLDSPQARAVGIGPKPSGQIDTLCDQSNPAQCRSLPGLGTATFGIRTPTADYDPVRAAAGTMIASAMRQVGLNAVAQPTAFGEIVNRVATRNFDLLILDWDLTTDPDYLFDLFHSSNAAAGRNYPGFANATYDATIEASRTELDRPTRRGFMFTAQEILAAARPYEPLYYRDRIEAYREDRFINWTFELGTNWNDWSLVGIHPPETYSITVTTVPAGLAVVVGGVTQTAPVTLTCTSTQTVDVGAVTPQVVSASRYTFVSWSDGGAPSHGVPCTGNQTVVAMFSVEHELIVQTSPPGISVTVEGVTAQAPVSEWCAAGATVDVSAPTPQGTGDTRLVFASWSDGGAASHAVTCSAPQTIAATFRTEVRITVDSDPPGAPLTLSTSAATPDGFWCREGATATVGAPQDATIDGRPYRFVRWSDGAAREHTISCAAPLHITATFEEIPFLEQHATTFVGVGILAAVLLVLFVFLLRRKRKRPAKE